MPIPKKIIKFLEKSKAKYETIPHRTVYTAFDKAKTLKIAEKIIGKTLILKLNGKLVIALIPANKNLDPKKIKKIAKVKKLDFASEKLIKNKFKGVKVGAIPPFGGLWGLATCIDKLLMKEKEIIVSGGDYNFSIKIKPKEFKKIIPDLFIGNYSQKKK